MNQQMQKLREQAMQYVGENHRIQYPNAITQQEIDQRFLMYEEKLAELIVKECSQAVLEVPCYYKDYRAQIEEVVINDCARAVLDHFGVEE